MDGSISRIYGGTGLGLTISKELGHLLEGKAGMESEHGKGSTFSLTLPRHPSFAKDFLEEGDQGQAYGKRKDGKKAKYTRKDKEDTHILLVDDDDVNRVVTQAILEFGGYQVTGASNAMNAIKLLEGDGKEKFDLVLMDMMMPGMDGFEATSIIRQTHSPKDLPIIALTAMAMKHEKQHCLDVGCNNYIIKPIQPDTLVSTIEETL